MNQCCARCPRGLMCTRRQQGRFAHVKDGISSQCVSVQMPWKLSHRHCALAFFLCVCLPTSCPPPPSIKAERPVHSRVQPVSWARVGGWREGDGVRVKKREEEGGFLMMMNRSPVLQYITHEGWKDGERREERQKAPPFLKSVSPISSSFCLLYILPPFLTVWVTDRPVPLMHCGNVVWRSRHPPCRLPLPPPLFILPPLTGSIHKDPVEARRRNLWMDVNIFFISQNVVALFMLCESKGHQRGVETPQISHWSDDGGILEALHLEACSMCSLQQNTTLCSETQKHQRSKRHCSNSSAAWRWAVQPQTWLTFHNGIKMCLTTTLICDYQINTQWFRCYRIDSCMQRDLIWNTGYFLHLR